MPKDPRSFPLPEFGRFDLAKIRVPSLGRQGEERSRTPSRRDGSELGRKVRERWEEESAKLLEGPRRPAVYET